MNRESNNYFSDLPYIEKPRSKFSRPQPHITTFKNGDLIPVYIDEVLPGDSMTIDVNAVVRMMTPIYPVMDNLILDVMAFYCPNRLLWTHWQEFLGENKLTAWEQPVKYEIPQIKAPEGGWKAGTIADYLGIPTYVENLSVNAMPFRAYSLIWNEFFRDENLKDRVMINLDDATRVGSNGDKEGDTYVTTAQLGAKPLKVAKTHDYFTSALPNTQKGEAVLIPVISAGTGGLIPVTAGERHIENGSVTGNGLLWATNQSGLNNWWNVQYDGLSDNKTVSTAATGGTIHNGPIVPANLYANLEDSQSLATIGTINELRQSFAIQRILEAMARGGSRYTEILKNIWGVTAPDARLQRPEYLGGERIPINMDQVLQTSASNGNNPLGDTGAFSNTGFSTTLVNKSFVEHGYVIIVAAARIRNHTYQQGLEKMWSRKTMYDFYMPQLAYLSEQAVLNKEIYAQGNREDEEVFGYQERWAEYRYKPGRVSGAMRSNYPNGSLDSWHYADDYVSKPMLSSEWIDEGTSEVDRTIAIQSELEDQFLADFLFINNSTRTMPIYSVPGLLDHY
ncbi:major capsid protein [Capybara microvirus Cap3_SP_389]|nr:major capsid protein [Capybara microvirus Cap3_SP_389]